MRYFEDFEVGELRRVGSCTASREEIVEFAERFDPLPFHIDEQAPRDSIFGELTGSSCDTFALMGAINASSPVENTFMVRCRQSGLLDARKESS